MTLFPKSRHHAVLLSAVTTLRSTGLAAGSSAVGGGAAAAFSSSAAAASPLLLRSQPYSRRSPPRHAGGSLSASAAAAARSSLIARQMTSSSPPGAGGGDGRRRRVELPNKTGDRNGLVRHEVIADDGHPLRLYSRSPRPGAGASSSLVAGGSGGGKQRSILLLHGRTWSSQPVFDLRTSDDDEKQQSTLQSLADLGFHAYALDLRGFGETPRDYHQRPVDDGADDGEEDHGGDYLKEDDGDDAYYGGYTTPRRCVADVKCAIDWITQRHAVDDAEEDAPKSSSIPGFEDPTVINTKPALLGWSQGALVAQMYAQQHGPATLSDLILFGSIFDPKVIYPRKPLYDPSGRLLVSAGPGSEYHKPPAPEVYNTDIASLEDFTLPGTICDEAALTFSSLALAVDPIKAAWDELHEFNVCNPALVHVPTLVIVGAQDPYVSWEAQRELFERLGTEDRAMCVLPGCDHAAHILKARKMFVRGVAGFLLRKDGF